VFDKYYAKTDDTPLYAAALILHPSHRLKYLEYNWDSRWIQPILRNVRKLWKHYQQNMPPILVSSHEQTSQNNEAESSLSSDTEPLDEFDVLIQNLTRFCKPSTDVDEYEEYCKGDVCKILCSPLQWWCLEEQRNRWPQLSYMAIDILSIPAMSDEPERVFSRARRTISWDRAQLGAATIESAECLKDWLFSNILEDENSAGNELSDD
jgi:hypothetical protein